MSRRVLKKKKKVPFLVRVGRKLYRNLFLFSLLIVGLYVGFLYLTSAPTHSKEFPTQAVTYSSNTNSKGVSTNLVRRSGVYTFLLAGSDATGVNADTIMVVSYDTKNQSVGVVSIPRDTIVNRSDQSVPKINAAYRGSDPAQQLKTAVSDLIGIPIDYYITVSISAFGAIVDAVGGIDFYVPCDMNYDDPMDNPPLSIHYSEGWYNLNGQRALEVARFRKNNDGTGYTDTGRTQTQQQLLVALAHKMLSPSGLFKFGSYIDVFNTYVNTDLDLNTLIWLGTKALALDFETDVSYATLPGDGTVKYKGYSWCYGLYPTKTLEIFNELINPYTSEITLEMTGIVIT